MRKGMLFRELYPDVLLGTASDRYAGWIGQIYTEGRYEKLMLERSRRIGSKTYKEKILPVESVEEYFEHFPVLELDFTFYQPLLEWDTRPTESYRLLRKYGSYLKKGDHIILKVPQNVLARRVYRGDRIVDNDEYLNPQFFTDRFYEPALRTLGSHLSGFVFEQGYQRKEDRVQPEELAGSLDSFFRKIPRDDRYHIEFRTAGYLVDPVFSFFEKHGVGQVLSHWTWLPRLNEQFGKSGRRFLNAGGQCVIRLMTPRGMRYRDTYEKAFPFDGIVDGMMSEKMVAETAQLIWEAVNKKVVANVIVNNRSGGNAPMIADLVAGHFLKIKKSAF